MFGSPSPASRRPGSKGRLHRLLRGLKRGLLGGFLILFAWALGAYAILPAAFSHFEHQKGLEGFEMVTRTAQGIAGDPIDVGLVGSRDEVLASMHSAGWYEADPVTLRSGLDIAGSVIFDRSYRDAPISPLFYLGRHQDLAFEKPVGTSADRRYHVRFWKVLDDGQEGRPVWLGSASYDADVGFSRYTGAVTHHIAPDVDAARDAMSADLAKARQVVAAYSVSATGPVVLARNGEGDPYHTDGEVRFSVLAQPGRPGVDPPPVAPDPPWIDVKDAIWRQLTPG